jgi:hypothetical protein
VVRALSGSFELAHSGAAADMLRFDSAGETHSCRAQKDEVSCISVRYRCTLSLANSNMYVYYVLVRPVRADGRAVRPSSLLAKPIHGGIDRSSWQNPPRQLSLCLSVCFCSFLDEQDGLIDEIAPSRTGGRILLPKGSDQQCGRSHYDTIIENKESNYRP